MTWGDGSIYKGNWENGVQNGLGVMVFSSGLKKAGTFKDNVLMELLTSPEKIDQQEAAKGAILPEPFKLELETFI